jgi:hypothetical protein
MLLQQGGFWTGHGPDRTRYAPFQSYGSKLKEEGKFQGYQKMITRRVALKDVVQQGFEELLNNKDKHVKIMISPKAFDENSLLAVKSQVSGRA